MGFGWVPTLAVCLVLICPVIGTAQESATVSVPDIAKAGETVSIKILLDKAPNFDGGSILVWVSGPEWGVQSSTQVSRGSNTATYSFKLPIDVGPGMCTISQLKFSAGSKMYDLHFAPVSFKVLANAGLIIPSSAEVAITPSQVQLLRREATRLQLQIEHLKAEFSGTRSNRIASDTLRKRVQEEIKSLQETASKFQTLSATERKTDVSDVFFADLQSSYTEVLSALSEAAEHEREPPLLRRVSREQKPSVPKYTLAALAVFRVYEHNELAYTLVADTGSLTFDLAVSSSPEGATVSYKRRGDQYKISPDPTNSVMKALPYAIWTIRFQKPGFREVEVEHDPFRESNHIVTALLIKKK